MAHISISKPTIAKVSIASLFIFEGLVIFLLTIALWYDNTIRPQWFWMFWLLIPIFAIRWHLTGRLWTHTRLHDVLLIFILLTAFSYAQAPLQKESYLAATARPLSGIWTFIYFIELTRTTKTYKIPIVLTIGMSFVLAFFALFTSQWVDGKTGFLTPLINTLPQLDYRTVAQQFDNSICSPLIALLHSESCFNMGVIIQRSFVSFNVNEIAGALAWVTPMMAGLALIPIVEKTTSKNTSWRIIKVMSGICFILLIIAMIFGQSRFALMGVFISLGILLIFSPISRRFRIISASVLGIVILMQLALLLNIFAPISSVSESADIGLSGRDSRSVSTRLQIWDRGIQMMTDHPFSGVGMYMFRTAVANEPYVIPYFQEQNNPPPHAHNEWIHMGAEMGIFGLLIFVAIQVTALYMLWIGWTRGNPMSKQIALAVFCGLSAHAIYGSGDTIALWDRFQFVVWWQLGLLGSQYVLTKSETNESVSLSNISKKITKFVDLTFLER